jgi:hypothetical protein
MMINNIVFLCQFLLTTLIYQCHIFLIMQQSNFMLIVDLKFKKSIYYPVFMNIMFTIII